MTGITCSFALLPILRTIALRIESSCASDFWTDSLIHRGFLHCNRACFLYRCRMHVFTQCCCTGANRFSAWVECDCTGLAPVSCGKESSPLMVREPFIWTKHGFSKKWARRVIRWLFRHQRQTLRDIIDLNCPFRLWRNKWFVTITKFVFGWSRLHRSGRNRIEKVHSTFIRWGMASFVKSPSRHH